MEQKIKITIKKDLTDVKVAEKKKEILKVIHKWLIENNSDKREEFRTEFLSDKHDKYFNEIKERIGEFEEIGKMSVLDFLASVIIGREYCNIEREGYEIIKELNKDFMKLMGNFLKNNPRDKYGKRIKRKSF